MPGPALRGVSPAAMTVRSSAGRTASPERVTVRCVVQLAVPRRLLRGGRGQRHPVFFFFSNRLGCLGSLLLSAVVTVVLLLLLDVL